ncbi:MAG: hypothetical protein PHS57_05945 [Alphaproteobacteria bacterium]|nr:hypothetical protein [Alphaproteobacteria bacterium]
MTIARVFPSRTRLTPTDHLAFVNCPPPLLALPEIDEVHVSVTFSWDMARAEQLAEAWRAVGVPVKLGGPAFNKPGGEFISGQYLKPGAVITSRGCPKNCWYCGVPRREGKTREYPIVDGSNVLDDNLLACSDTHIRAVFEMLARQSERPIFTGGLEAEFLKPWQAEALHALHPRRMYFAYDTPDDRDPLFKAGRILRDAGFTFEAHVLCCYCLIGYQGDTFERAEKRLTDIIRAGFMPYAMLYRNESGAYSLEWRRFQREWLRPEIVATKANDIRRTVLL